MQRNSENLRFRQIHLDFHTSELIPGIGEKFDKKKWQETLLAARVNSITCFSMCHHGVSYHPTQVGRMHPHLKFNLLRAQMDACKELNINVPVYLSAGINMYAWQTHPEWAELQHTGKGADPLWPGFQKMCLNGPYLDYLCNHIHETAEMFPEADGIFLDIIHQGQCCCKWCMQGMMEAGLKPEIEADRKTFSRRTIIKYMQRTTEAARERDARMRVFHNSGHITPGDTEVLKYQSHLELESLPTGGWGYDHFPLSVAYSRNLGKDYLGMTGKFHTTWGEFGGFKHPNALRYECAAMLANGSKCSIGDQMHPCGELDPSTYELIGTAYKEVEAKEPWCDNVTSAATIALLSSSSEEYLQNGSAARKNGADIGASRLLLESHLPFDMLDRTMPFDRYRVIILPDDIRLDAQLEAKVNAFLKAGGKVILSAESGLRVGENAFGLPMVAYEGVTEFNPNYILPEASVAPDFVRTPFVMYAKAQLIKASRGRSLGKLYDTYFNRSYRHFCSHQQTPYTPEPSAFDCGVILENVLYFAHPVFNLYRSFGAVALKQYIMNAIRQFIGQDCQVRSNLPSQARVTLMQQAQQRRYVVHALYATPSLRGSNEHTEGIVPLRQYPLEAIEDLMPIADVELSVKVSEPVKRVTLEPQGQEIPFGIGDGRVDFKIDKLLCHQMAVLHY